MAQASLTLRVAAAPGRRVCCCMAVRYRAAGIVLVRSDPRGVVSILRLARATYGKMVQNLAWATGYNAIAIPLAAGVLAGRGLLLSPAVGAALMSVSTVIVAVNARLLREPRGG